MRPLTAIDNAMSEITKELDRLRAVYEKLGLAFHTDDGASVDDIQEFEQESGLQLPDDLRSMFLLTEGVSRKSDCTTWFLVAIDDEPMPMRFLGLRRSIESWRAITSSTVTSFEQENIQGDDRISRQMYSQNRLLIASMLGSIAGAYADFTPTPHGDSGQIIANCSESNLWWMAKGFLQFFRQSNDLFEERLAEDQEYLESLLR